MKVIVNTAHYYLDWLSKIPPNIINSSNLHIVGVNQNDYSIPLKSIYEIQVMGDSMLIAMDNSKDIKWFNLENIILITLDERK